MQHDFLTSFPNIETERLLLRQAIEEDAGDILAIFSDPDVAQFHNFDTFGAN